jgi:hypothetical protein
MTAPWRTAGRDASGLPALITAAQIARLLRVSTGTFLRQRDRLADDEGFPLPLPHSRRPLYWRRDAVLTWIGGQGEPRPPTGGGNVVLLREARRA